MLANVKGVDLNKIDVIHNDWNAFHYAILQDNVAALEILLEAGADGDQKDGIGRSPAVIAGDHYKQKTLAFLENRWQDNKIETTCKDLYQVQETWKFFDFAHIQLCTLIVCAIAYYVFFSHENMKKHPQK